MFQDVTLAENVVFARLYG